MKTNMKITKLLYPFANVMGIFFPVGRLKDNGTCEFATNECLKNCIAIKNKKECIGYTSKENIYQFFQNENVTNICIQLCLELDRNNCNIIAWFASGDCPSYMTDKIVKIIEKLQERKIVQCGFTRNINLWEKITDKGLCINKDLRFIITLEEGKEKVFCENYIYEVVNTYQEYDSYLESRQLTPKILYAIPNYITEKTEIYLYNRYRPNGYYECGHEDYSTYEEKTSKIKEHEKFNCKNCYKNKKGCFIKI